MPRTLALSCRSAISGVSTAPSRRTATPSISVRWRACPSSATTQRCAATGLPLRRRFGPPPAPSCATWPALPGTVLQRTRCSYFRDPSWTACNKRTRGSGCAAIGGSNRLHPVLGTSAHCIASYPGDLATVLVAFGATVDLVSGQGARTIAFEELHLLPGDRPRPRDDAAPRRAYHGVPRAARALGGALALPQGAATAIPMLSPSHPRPLAWRWTATRCARPGSGWVGSRPSPGARTRPKRHSRVRCSPTRPRVWRPRPRSPPHASIPTTITSRSSAAARWCVRCSKRPGRGS